ncbi:hypothetical protein GE061_018150 [Apolygus lucorum]|uniref:DDE Tnp4 domain-containing protein n=1 Tax=Apolygus lucorum TaxID=248454 RepID=A0A8S9XEG5_APOLU|nr:hypothetical protein GE061_018150 [Apolygus lucorum]
MDGAPVSCIPTNQKMSKAKKIIDEAREIQNPELDLAEKGIASFDEMPGLFNMMNITRLTLTHNKLKSVPPGLANLSNLEILNLFNNLLEELPISLSSLPKLRILNVGMNRLFSLPRGFGAFPALEVLDLTYNNLDESGLPGNFYMLETLRALYLGDNDFEFLHPEIKQLKNLQICDKTREFSIKRKAEWLSRINRDMRGKKVDGVNIRVCDRHFISGKPSGLFECSHPDWAPSLHLGYGPNKSTSSSEVALRRYDRVKNGRKKVLHTQPRFSTEEQEQYDLLIPSEMQPSTSDHGDYSNFELQEIKIEEMESPMEFCQVYQKVTNDVECQVDLMDQELAELRSKHDSMAQKQNLAERELVELRMKYVEQLHQNTVLRERITSKTERVSSMMTSMQKVQAECDMLRKDNEWMRDENRKLKLNLKNVSIDEDSLRDDDEKTNFLTGLKNFKLLKSVYDFVEVEIPHSYRNTLPKFSEFVLTLMRLRLGVLEQDLAYRFNVSATSVSCTCSCWIRAMSFKLGRLIVWPERANIQRTLPQDFKSVFGDRFAVILYRFEVFLNRPNLLWPKAGTSSKYKKDNSVRFFVGITPQGTVCFVSRAWDGKAADKYSTLKSGFLDKLMLGDVVITDRGFNIDEESGLIPADISIPVFTKGETPLSFDDVQKAEEIAKIKLHVARLVGFIQRQFRYLGSILPQNYLTVPLTDDIPPIDQALRICCGLSNICSSYVRDGETSDASKRVDNYMPISKCIS